MQTIKGSNAGVYFKKDRLKWQAVINTKGKGYHLGYFDKVEDAISARKEAERRVNEECFAPAPLSKEEIRLNRAKPRNNTSGVQGVSWHKVKNKWQAIITVERKQIHLGLFADFSDAVAAREAARIKYFG